MPGLVLASCPGLERAGQVSPVRIVYAKERIALPHLGVKPLHPTPGEKKLKIRKKDALYPQRSLQAGDLRDTNGKGLGHATDL